MSRRDLANFGQQLTERTAIALMLQKLRELEELSRAMANMRGDVGWLKVADYYAANRGQLTRLAEQKKPLI